MGARVVSVDGPFNSRVLVDMSADEAHELLGEEFFTDAAPSVLREAVEQDLRLIAERDEQLASGTLAATARTLALRLENPYTSSTAAAMCAGKLIETMDRLRELAPERQEGDQLDDLSARRAARLAGGAAASNPARS